MVFCRDVHQSFYGSGGLCPAAIGFEPHYGRRTVLGISWWAERKSREKA
jgi:hypothetical protein